MAMGKAAILAVAAVAALAVQVQLAAAADHPVGGDGTWDASGNGYDAWSAKQKFNQGDTVSFKFSPSHDVTEVSKAGYDACSGANPVKSYTGGSATVKLTAPGKRYFICSVPGHCAAGMKLEVTTVAAAGPAVTGTGTATAPAPAKTTTKPRHQRSAAPTPAPAPAPAPGPDAAATSTDDLPNVSSPTAAPKSSSAAAAATTLGAKAVVGLAVAVAMAALAM